MLSLEGRLDLVYPLSHGLFSLVLTLQYARKKIEKSLIFLIDNIISISSLAIPLFMNIRSDTDPWVLFGAFYLLSVVVRSVLVILPLYWGYSPHSKTWNATVILAVFVMVFGIQQWIMIISIPDGDEPYYMLVAMSLIKDHDLDLTNNFENKDYASFFPFTLKEFYLEHEGKRATNLPIGLPLLIAPGMAVAGWRGTLIVMALFAGVLVQQWLQLALTVTQDKKLIFLIGASFCFSYPLLTYYTRIYPEIPAALIVVLLLRIIQKDFSILRILSFMLLISFMALLKLRLLLLGIPLLIWYLIKPRSRKYLLISVGALLIIGICIFVYIKFFQGAAHVSYRFVEFTRMRMPNFKPVQGFFGILLDQQFGLLFRNPLYLLSIFGLIRTVRRNSRSRLFLLSVIPYFGAVISIEFWTGGWSPAPRFLVPILPVCALWALMYVKESGITTLAITLWIFGVISTVMSIGLPQTDYYFVEPPHGADRIAEKIGSLYDLSYVRLFPSLFRPGLATGLAIGMFCLLLLYVGVRRHRDQTTLFPIEGRVILAVFLVLSCFLLSLIGASIIPVSTIEIEDTIYDDNGLQPVVDGMEIIRPVTIAPRTWSNTRHILIWAQDKGAGLGNSINLQADGKSLGVRAITRSTFAPAIWDITKFDGVIKTTIEATTLDGAAPRIQVDCVDFIPDSPMLSRLSLMAHVLFYPFEDQTSVSRRVIRTFLMDEESVDAALELCEHFMQDSRYLELLQWIPRMPPTVIGQLPREIRVRIAEEAAIRGKSVLVSLLLGSLVDDRASKDMYQVNLITALRTGVFDAIESAAQEVQITDPIQAYYYQKMAHNAGKSELEQNLTGQWLAKNDPVYRYLMEHYSESHQEQNESLLVLPYSYLKASSGLYWEWEHCWNMTTNGSLSALIPILSNYSSVSALMRGMPAKDEWPEVLVYLDGQLIARFIVDSFQWKSYQVTLQQTEGLHHIEFVFTNDYFYAKDGTDRNVLFRELVLRGIEP